ncbi:MAG: hypothetical protein OXG35_31130, partial [Acidobacteria bacterium]|nr:hypothetical protein [Acidobacteriota bacterium]
MPERPIVILHGWSDTSATFEPLARLLRARLGREVSIVSLADYVSMEDEVRFDDVAEAMDVAWRRHELPRGKGAVDAVVHSTGGLVVRDWLARHSTPARAPVKPGDAAPANFGSHLAHKAARSSPGLQGLRRKKPRGAGVRDRHPHPAGARARQPLHVAARRARPLRPRRHDVPAGNVLCTVLVGNRGFRGISSIANEDGSDGTVRASTANMDCVRIGAVFPARPEAGGAGVKYTLEASSGSTAFGLLEHHNHGTITLSHRRRPFGEGGRNTPDGDLFEKIVRGLTVDDDGFEAWRQELEAGNRALLPA